MDGGKLAASFTKPKAEASTKTYTASDKKCSYNESIELNPGKHAPKPTLIVETGGAVDPPMAENLLAIRLLGPMQIEVRGRAIARQRNRKTLWLLALLALRRDKDVERGWLAGTLWPESDEARALRNLRQALHELRTALGESSSILTSESPRTIRFNSEGVILDCANFERYASRGEWAAAIRAYGGPLLEGCPEAWANELRGELESQYLLCLRNQAELGDSEEAVRLLRIATSTSPYQEELWRGLMRAQTNCGSPAAAIRSYHEFRSLLWREMSTFPEEETTQLFEAILSQGRATPTPLPKSQRTRPQVSGHRLPIPLTTLIGRESELEGVQATLRNSRLVSLVGTGGVGKTRLALKVAQELVDRFEHGATWVSLGPISDPAHVSEAVREALAIPSGDERVDPVQAVETFLADRQQLLVLDNCEHLVEPCSSLAERWLAASKGLRIVTTSRQPLGVRGEAVFQVGPLTPPPESAREAELKEFAAVRLFVERAKDARASFDLDPETAMAVGKICRQLDGLPLAIELAAARVRSVPLESIHARLKEDATLLKASAAENPRHASLEKAIRWSWDLLSATEQAVLSQLSVFAGSWTLAAAEAVCSEQVEQYHVLDRLASLVDRSLVVFDPIGESRYGMMETIRQFALERLTESGGLTAARDRHLDYFLAWAEAARPRQLGAEQAVWFERLERDHDNLRAALSWALERGEPEKELRLALALGRFWDTHGHVREGRKRLEAALSRSTAQMPPGLLGDAYGAAGWFALLQGDDAATESNYGLALKYFRESGEELKGGMALQFLGCIAAKRDYDKGKELLLEALEIHQKAGRAPVAILQNLGEAAIRHGLFLEAREHLEASLACCGSESFAEMRFLILCNLSEVEFQEGLVPEARAKTSQALQGLLECGAFIYIPQALDQAGMHAFSSEAWERSAILFGAAEAMGEAYGVDPGELHAAEREAAVSDLEAKLGAGFVAMKEMGKSLSPEEAVEHALKA